MTKMGYQAESVLSYGLDWSGILCDAAPSVTWQRLFGNFVPDDPKAILRRDLEVGVLDRVRGQYDRVAKHPRLSSEDQAAADRARRARPRCRAADSRDRSELRLPPDAPIDPSMDDDIGLADVTDLNIDLLAALACDRTRVGVMQLCVGTDLRFNHHGVSHDSKFTQDATD